MTPPVPARSPVSVRPAVNGDIARLAELLDGGAMTAKEDPGDLRPYAAALDEITATPGNTVLVAEVDGRVVGMYQLLIFRHLQERGGWCAEVESVHVDASVRSSGIGSAMMDDALARARRAGCYRLQLTSNVARPDAQRWYRRLGFVASHAGFKYYLRGDVPTPG
jgi:GNAT superfamily N-acetyltransferase